MKQPFIPIKALLPLALLLVLLVEPVYAVTRLNYCKERYDTEDLNTCTAILREQGINYVDIFEATGGGSAAGSLECITKDFPAVNDEAGFAAAINQYIDDYLGERTSPFQGLGSSFVNGGRDAEDDDPATDDKGVNPMLAVAHLQIESGLAHTLSGWAGDTYATEAAAYAQDQSQRAPSNNAFGREGNPSSQPVVYYLDGSGRIRTPYQWADWADSLEGEDPWFDLIARRYNDIPATDWTAYINRYAPPTDGNDVAHYVESIQTIMQEIVELAGPALGCGEGAGNFIWPIRQSDYVRLTTCWNTPRTLNGNSYRHGGLDISAGSGTDILASAAGEVVFAGDAGGNGNMIVLRHEGGLFTIYKHQQSFADGMVPGNFVDQGEVIGYVDNTGASTGDHLHFDIGVIETVTNANADNPNRTKNPLDYLPEDGRNLDTGGTAGECVPSSVNSDGYINGGGQQVIDT